MSLKIDRALKRKRKEYDKLEDQLKQRYLQTAAFNLSFEQWCEECEEVWDLLDELETLETEIKVLREWGK